VSFERCEIQQENGANCLDLRNPGAISGKYHAEWQNFMALHFDGADEASAENTKRALRVLICEDEGLIVIQLRHALENAGFEVVGEALDGEGAFRLTKELAPDFVLMDVTLSGTDGIEATERIMREHPVAVIILTAHADEHTVEAAVDAGACGYVVKPVVSEQLIPAIEAAIGRYEVRYQ
jgi:AmiR/NasT family two-component response regulator